MRHAMLTVFGNDRPGIIALVSGILFRSHCNLEDMSMTILEGEFAMMLVVGYRGVSDREKILCDFRQDLEKKWKLSFYWKDLTHTPRRGEKHIRNSQSYLIRVAGKDRTGIVYRTSQLAARMSLNITDLNCRILGYGSKAVYLLLAEVDIPQKVSSGRVKAALDALGRCYQLSVQLKSLEPLTI